MSIEKTLNMLLEPIGLKARSFAVDYQDKNGNDYNADFVCSPMPGTSDDFIIAGIIQNLKSRGYICSAVHEMLDGYSRAELDEMVDSNPQEAVKHIKLVYLKR